MGFEDLEISTDSSLEPITISYHFAYAEGEGRQTTIVVELEPETLSHRHPRSVDLPEWTLLELHRCCACPLDPAKHERCPAAVSLVDLVDQFQDMLSYTDVAVEVVTKQRTVMRRTSVQKALSSLMGLYMATSGCPILGRLKPMARFHLPFANREETMFRSVGAYLTAQYFLRKRGKAFDADLSGLQRLYHDVHQVNVEMTNRIRHVTTGDASINAMVLLDIFAQDLPFSIDENLVELEHLFEPFLRDTGISPEP